MEMNQKREYRQVNLECKAESKDESGKKLVVRGYPILFNTETEINDFWYGTVREKILPTALEGTDLSDVYLVTGHNYNPEKVLGRAGINMRLEVDETGLFMECELPNTQHARDIYNLIERGIVDGMSFGFYCSDEINPATKERTITHIDELLEVTITPFPAYKEASVIAQKQRQDEEDKQRQRQAELDAEKVRNEREARIKALEKELG